jgi:hypothetical protein
VILTPFEAVTAEPLVVEDPFGAGWKFHCVRSTARRFEPWRMRIATVARKVKLQTRIGEATVGKMMDNADVEAVGRAILLLDDELLADIDAERERDQESGPRDAEGVASLILGWEGLEENGPVPYSHERALSLLGDIRVGDSDMAVMNGEGPLKLPDGEFAGYTVGEALCVWIPEQIHVKTLEEQAAIAEKKALPESARPSGVGSGTATKEKRTKRTKAG